MRQTLNHVCWTAAIAAALLTAVIGSWHDMSVAVVAVRCLVVGLLVLAFLRGGSELAWRAVLRSLAEYQIRQEEERRERARNESRERRKGRTEATDSTMEPPRTVEGREARFTDEGRTVEAVSGERASQDRKAA